MIQIIPPYSLCFVILEMTFFLREVSHGFVGKVIMKRGVRMKWNRIIIACILGAAGVFFSTGCSVFGIRTSEEAGYRVIGEYGQFEIRDYDELVVVETDVNSPFAEAGSIAFNRLFDYISGENVAQKKIAMTAPVMAKKGNMPEGKKIAMTSPVIGEKMDIGWRYIFVLPASYTLESAPAPSDPLVKLSVMPRKKVAVIRYSGSRGEKSIRQKSDALVDWIQSKGLEINSKPRSAGYDPPWTLPFFRRNEVMIDVK